MAKRTIDSVEVADQRVFVRADFNVPLDGREITDDRRIRLTLPTLESVLSRGGSIIAASHLGRPEGKGFEADSSIEPVRKKLEELLGSKARGGVKLVGKVPTDPEAAAAAAALKPGEVLLLENLRFEKGEKKGDPAFAAKLAGYGTIYCNDAFGASHRTDASMLALPMAMKPRHRVAGLLLARELIYLSETLANPARPFVAILGGAKVSDKLPALKNLIGRVESIIVGGAMAYTFLLAQGHSMGRSRVQSEMVDDAKAILALAAEKGTQIILPLDHVCAAELAPSAVTRTVCGDIPGDLMGLDIGPASEEAFASHLLKAKTIVWNGPMGVFETPPFNRGTNAIAKAVAEATRRGATTIAGGGDTAAAVEAAGVAEQLSHISTGGGASLEMLEGKHFESLDALEDA
ncbi:MAG: phosphoglycerate kinase [Phycisphaeraceae bacterium]|nr:phosphoglycerate kinase [Phycisphaeraceae bacterium]